MSLYVSDHYSIGPSLHVQWLLSNGTMCIEVQFERKSIDYKQTKWTTHLSDFLLIERRAPFAFEEEKRQRERSSTYLRHSTVKCVCDLWSTDDFASSDRGDLW